MWSKTGVKPVRVTLSESDQNPEFWPTLGSKMAQKLALESHIIHIYESSSNEHIEQDRCESRILNFNSFGGPKWPKNLCLYGIFYTPTK